MRKRSTFVLRFYGINLCILHNKNYPSIKASFQTAQLYRHL